MLVVGWVVIGASAGWVVALRSRRYGADARLGCLAVGAFILLLNGLRWAGALSGGTFFLVLASFIAAFALVQAVLGQPPGFGTLLQWRAFLVVQLLMVALCVVGALAAEDLQD